VKWSRRYQRKHRIRWGPAHELGPEVEAHLRAVACRTYRILGLSGYARIDFRMDAEGRAHVLEANPNPDIGLTEEFAQSAAKAKVSYDALLARILRLGLGRRPAP
jgi:D-alanine-D-alanine ligase